MICAPALLVGVLNCVASSTVISAELDTCPHDNSCSVALCNRLV